MTPRAPNDWQQRLTRSVRRRRLTAAGASVLLHLTVLLLAFLAPALAARRAEPVEFVPVQLVPAQALGVRRPAPPAPARPEPPPTPAPEPVKPEVEAPEPLPDPPVIAEPRRKPTRDQAPPSRPSPTPDPGPSSADPVRREGSPTGSTFGTSGFGAAVAGLDNPDFTYDYYVTQMLTMIRANWLRPPLGGRIEAVVHYRIQKDGRATDVRITASSGYSSFDLAALRAVEAASPFPPLPRSYGHDSLGVSLIVR